MAAKPPIVFKCEASLWDMMAELDPYGRSAKPFDMRRWDMADDRIYRLAWGTYGSLHRGEREQRVGLREKPMPALTRVLERREWKWTPDIKQVSFLNKATGGLLTFEYLGVQFTDWAPGWGFLLLGKRLHPPVEET